MDNKQKIINYLGKNLQSKYTMHQLSKLLHIPYASFYRTIQKMKDLLIIETIGKSKAIALNLNNPVAKAHLVVASDEERKEFLRKHKIINVIARELNTMDIVILFGSYAKGKQTEGSDIDLLIINKDGKKSLSFSKFELLYKKVINPIFITKQEFKSMLKDKDENLAKQSLKGHVILNDPVGFWRYVLDV